MPLSVPSDADTATSVYDFTVLDADNNEYNLAQRRGHPTLFFNSASGCGFAKSSFEAAHKLHQKYKDYGFLPISFPSGTFSQEPLSGADAKKHGCSTYHIEFPVMAKVEVNGSDACPVWKWLQKERTGFLWTAFIKWNFTSFLVDGSGKVVERFSPGMNFESIEAMLIPLLAQRIEEDAAKKKIVRKIDDVRENDGNYNNNSQHNNFGETSVSQEDDDEHVKIVQGSNTKNHYEEERTVSKNAHDDDDGNDAVVEQDFE